MPPKPLRPRETTAQADEVILAVKKRMDRDGLRFHTISLVVEVMTEELGYVQKRKAPERVCFRCKQKSAELSNGECRECHNAYQRRRRHENVD